MPVPSTFHSIAHRHAARRAGFSLTELLVVIGIIVLLVGILLVALGQVQVKARRTQTESTMRQFMNACSAFQAENDRLPGVIPETLINANPQITSMENALLDLLGGYRVLIPTDSRTAGNPVFDDYQNYLAAATTTSSNVVVNWNTPSGDWDLVIDTRKIGEGPVINGKPHAAYFTPGASELVRASYPPATNNAGDPTTVLPDLVDAWGQPMLYLRQLRNRGPLVALANNTPAPQFLRGGVMPYLSSTSLGELAKDQNGVSTLLTAPDVNATLGRMLWQGAITDQSKGALCVISAGPDGVYFSRVDGPGTESAPIDDIVTNGQPEVNNVKVVDDYDDVRVFGGA
jgi:prepilin-type N-terminal cleavage/methylation domain-containing protein